MEKFVKGDIVVLPFPFSDLSSSKKRPALVVANPLGGDILLMQITSQGSPSDFSIVISRKDFLYGSLPVKSFVKLQRLFSADLSIIKYKIGNLKQIKINEIEHNLINFIKR